MSPDNIAAFTANSTTDGTVAKSLISACQDTIDHPNNYTMRGNVDADTWPGAAWKCAFSWVVTKSQAHLTQAIKYLNASLNDDQMLGDNKGCVSGVNTDWKSWNGNNPAPAVIITVTHDTGYPMRWYGPDISMVYDWIYAAPGVDDNLRAHTRMCLQNWVDYYTAKGYHNHEAGSNYNAGYVLGKVMASVAMAGENGADSDRIWNESIDEVMNTLLIGKGLANKDMPVGTPHGVMVGGDWGEGWQYGAYSVIEYGLAARLMEENGYPLPDLDAWTNSLIVRAIYGAVPHLDGQYVGGDIDAEQPYSSPPRNLFDAILAGPSSDQAAAWARNERMVEKANANSTNLGNLMAELRVVAPQEYRTQTPAPPLWYLALGTRTLYARTGWSQDDFYTVFESAPQVNADHHHFDATTFVLTRGGDHLIVDPSAYGSRSTLPTNAITADSTSVTGTYAPSQSPSSKAELLWARGTDSGVFAARGDIANAFNFSDKLSDIPYAHREWTFLPEGEIVTIDRIQTVDKSHFMYVQFHGNTGGTMKLEQGGAWGTVGGSVVAIHEVMASGGTAVITQQKRDDNYRMDVDKYLLKVPGPWAVAIHVIDGLAAGDNEAQVGSLNDATYDPNKDNNGIIGAAVFRSDKQSYVVASAAQQGASGDTMTYSVPGGSAGRHIVYDAPEDGSGKSMVAASVSGDRCALSITAGAGFTGHPLMFQVSSAADGCTVTEDVDVAGGTPPPGGGSHPPGMYPLNNVGGGGCCAIAGEGTPAWPAAALAGAIAIVVGARRRRR